MMLEAEMELWEKAEQVRAILQNRVPRGEVLLTRDYQRGALFTWSIYSDENTYGAECAVTPLEFRKISPRQFAYEIAKKWTRTYYQLFSRDTAK